MTGLVIVVGLVAVALLAPRYGMDLRDSGDWRWQTDRSVPVRGAARHNAEVGPGGAEPLD